MIRVYLDYGSTTEYIASFVSEEVYALAVPALEVYADSYNAELIERVECVAEKVADVPDNLQAEIIQEMLDDLYITEDVFNYVYVHDIVEYKNNLENGEG